MKFRTIELRDADDALVCDEPIHQPESDEVFEFATFGGRLFRFDAASAGAATYYEIPALRCGRTVITDGTIEGVEPERIAEALS